MTKRHVGSTYFSLFAVQLAADPVLTLISIAAKAE
jgi:hypothetical protein